jgi:hypothetical protein
VATAVRTADVDVVSPQDVDAVVDHTLRGLGLSFDDLAAQARSGHFDSIEARLAWLAIGELYQR